MTVKELCKHLQENFDPETNVVINYVDIYNNPHERPLLKESIQPKFKMCYFNTSY